MREGQVLAEIERSLIFTSCFIQPVQPEQSATQSKMGGRKVGSHRDGFAKVLRRPEIVVARHQDFSHVVVCDERGFHLERLRPERV